MGCISATQRTRAYLGRKTRHLGGSCWGTGRFISRASLWLRFKGFTAAAKARPSPSELWRRDFGPGRIRWLGASGGSRQVLGIYWREDPARREYAVEINTLWHLSWESCSSLLLIRSFSMELVLAGESRFDTTDLDGRKPMSRWRVGMGQNKIIKTLKMNYSWIWD